MPNEIKNALSAIEEKIRSGLVAKHSRAYFMLRRVAIMLGTIIVLALAVYLGSFIFFITYTQRAWLLTDFGWRGYINFFLSLPWLIVGLVLALIVIIELVGWRFTSLYRKPLVYSALLVFLVVLAASAIVERTNLHPNLYQSSRQNNWPMGGFLYHHFIIRHLSDGYFARVEKTTTSSWEVETNEAERVVITITPETRFPLGNDIVLHDHILIFGPRGEGHIFARGIRKLSPEMMPHF